MTHRFKTIIEPFRIHSVEPLRMSTEQERRGWIEDAGYNLFALRAEDVLIDLLTDSGTGAMSSTATRATPGLLRGFGSWTQSRSSSPSST
jgi:tryptophanase